ncbi:MAG TPA: DUF494 domain-containing protein [Burkholderiales bacterium]|nr:DUF494 domain-containing protein [Pseudomonadota bacterium]HVC48714.1 DUF494 domain-containing protein [Burkholderiales bacterium]
MFDILVYLFENYFEADIHPDQNVLTRELTQAGFDSKEINLAFDWLRGLESLPQNQPYPESLANSASYRIYAGPELQALDSESRGFLTFLSISGILNPIQREWIIDRALAIKDEEVSLEHIKWITLMVLWCQGQAHDYLFIEELLFGEGDPLMH